VGRLPTLDSSVTIETSSPRKHQSNRGVWQPVDQLLRQERQAREGTSNTISQIGSDSPSASILCVLCDSVVQFVAIVFRNSIRTKD